MCDSAAGLADALGYAFGDTALLDLALVHRSFSSEEPGEDSNERLEFLGDAVLGLVIAHELFDRWHLPEGQMAKVRAAVVNEAALALVARSIGLGDRLRLGRGEETTGGRDKDSILADAMEAVLGAVYLDGGLGAARSVIVAHWAGLIEDRVVTPGGRDYKTRLQEELARNGVAPEYRVVGEGPDHARVFLAEVLVDGAVVGSGTGTSKKRAEQAAASEALGGSGDA